MVSVGLEPTKLGLEVQAGVRCHERISRTVKIWVSILPVAEKFPEQVNNGDRNGHTDRMGNDVRY